MCQPSSALTFATLQASAAQIRYALNKNKNSFIIVSDDQF